MTGCHGFLNDQQIIDLTLTSSSYDGLAALMAMAEQGIPSGGELPSSRAIRETRPAAKRASVLIRCAHKKS